LVQDNFGIFLLVETLVMHCLTHQGWTEALERWWRQM